MKPRCQRHLFKWILLIMVSALGANGQSEQGPQETAGFNYLDDDKRSHNIMRFGKRESWDDILDAAEEPHRRFEKRQSLSNDDDRYPELLRILRSEDRDSWKRGHNIMRFGKRADDHHFIHFGKRDSGEEIRHKILSFGKRGSDTLPPIGLDNSIIIPQSSDDFRESLYQAPLNPSHKRFPHSMIHFGKRLPFGNSEEDEDFDGDLEPVDDDIEKRAHSMIHFGKREDAGKRMHSLIHFGKRPFQGHRNLHFGKRLTDSERKRTHSMMHFGKRLSEEIKRAHSMIHFGKKSDPDEEKRSHALLHFGKRSDPEMQDIDDSGKNGMVSVPELDQDVTQDSAHIRKRRTVDEEPVRQHNILRFGRR